jgi:hypothetical protein
VKLSTSGPKKLGNRNGATLLESSSMGLNVPN